MSKERDTEEGVQCLDQQDLLDKIECLVGYLEAFVDGKYGAVCDLGAVPEVIDEANKFLRENK